MTLFTPSVRLLASTLLMLVFGIGPPSGDPDSGNEKALMQRESVDGKLSFEVQRIQREGQPHVRTVVTLADGEQIRSSPVRQTQDEFGFSPVPRPIMIRWSGRSDAAYALLFTPTPDELKYELWHFDVASKEFLPTKNWVESIQYVFFLEQIPDSSSFIELSLCVHWNGPDTIWPCPFPPLRIRVLSETYALEWEQYFDIDRLPKPPPKGTTHFEALTTGAVEVVSLRPMGFEVLCVQSNRAAPMTFSLRVSDQTTDVVLEPPTSE